MSKILSRNVPNDKKARSAHTTQKIRGSSYIEHRTKMIDFFFIVNIYTLKRKKISISK